MMLFGTLGVLAFLSFFCWVIGYFIAQSHPPEWYFDGSIECDPEPEEPPQSVEKLKLKDVNIQDMTIDEIKKFQEMILKHYGLK